MRPSAGRHGEVRLGFVECGTVTPRPQAGNPRPRLFGCAGMQRFINRMGFSTMAAARRRRKTAGTPRARIVGINIGANKDSSDVSATMPGAFRACAIADMSRSTSRLPTRRDCRGCRIATS